MTPTDLTSMLTSRTSDEEPPERRRIALRNRQPDPDLVTLVRLVYQTACEQEDAHRRCYWKRQP